MISRTLPTVDRTFGGISWQEVGEALALTCLSYYSEEQHPERVVNAFKRAWGLTSYDVWRVSGLTPGFITAYGQTDIRQTMTIAISGMTSLSQIASMIQLGNKASPDGLLTMKEVYSRFLDVANSVWDQMHANVEIMAKIRSGLFTFTFTGHSLGAAAADLLAYRWKKTYPAKPVRLIKFGCPRVGNTFYVNRNDNQVLSTHVVCREDPIFNFPSALLLAGSPQNIVGFVTRLNSCTDDSFQILDPSGRVETRTNASSQSYSHIQNALDLARGRTGPGYPWYAHDVRSYRLWFMNSADRANDLLAYRFNFLELPDENAWQVRYVPGMVRWDVMNVNAIIFPQPAERAPQQPAVAQQLAAPRPVPANAAAHVADLAIEAPAAARQIVPVIPPPVVTQHRSQRRVTRARPN